MFFIDKKNVKTQCLSFNVKTFCTVLPSFPATARKLKPDAGEAQIFSGDYVYVTGGTLVNIGPLSSTFNTIHPIALIFGRYNELSLYF